MHRVNGQFSYLIRTERWAYFQYDENAGSGMELFDMDHDPKQYNNLAGNPKYKDIVQDLQEKLKLKLQEIRDNDLGKNYNTDLQQDKILQISAY